MNRVNRVAIQRLRILQCISGKRAISSCPGSNQNQKTLEDIPGPRLLPLVGSMFDFLFYKGGLSKARIHLPQERVKEFGKIYYERIASKNKTVFIADPKDVELVFRSENSSSYPTRMVRTPLFEYFWKKYNREPGVFFLDGVKWYKYRSSLSKRMLVPRSIAQHTPEMNVIASDVVTRLKTLLAPEGSETSNEVGNIDYELFKWSFESVSYVIFEKRFGSVGDNMDPKVHEFIQATGRFLGSILPTAYLPPKFYDYYQTKSYKTFASSYDKMYDLAQYFIIQQIDELEKSEELISSGDNAEVSLLQYLMFKKKFSQNDLLACIIDLMFAGVDTTSNTMQWILYELAKNPEKQAALFDEITTTLPGQCTVSNNQLQNLPYLKAVVKETLRLHPVLAQLPRVLQQDLVLSGYKVPAGTQVLIPLYAVGHDSDIYHDPEQFLPERWLRTNKQNYLDIFGSLPFGFGRRMCLGRRLAELEIHVLLFHIMLNFHLEYPKNVTMETVARGTLIPEKPVRVKFIKRICSNDH